MNSYKRSLPHSTRYERLGAVLSDHNQLITMRTKGQHGHT